MGEQSNTGGNMGCRPVVVFCVSDYTDKSNDYTDYGGQNITNIAKKSV
jgi:hypothetical protein